MTVATAAVVGPEPEVIARREGVAGILSLNRPRAIHALTAGMNRAMTAALLAWRDDPEVAVVILDHRLSPDGDPKLSRGFCSGGDVTLLRHSALNDGGVAGRQFFFEEYQLNHLILTYPKPVIAFMDGITMGGGVGISGIGREGGDYALDFQADLKTLQILEGSVS